MGEILKYEKAEFVKKVGERAYDYEKTYHGCCQSVLAALQDAFDLRDDAVFRACSGFAGGIGASTKSVCGGLSAGSLFISYLVGRKREADGSFADLMNERFKANKYCEELVQCYVREYGSPNCTDVQRKILDGNSYVLSDPVQYQEFCEQGAHTHPCPSVCSKAARWTSEIILNNLESFGLIDRIYLEDTAAS